MKRLVGWSLAFCGLTLVFNLVWLVVMMPGGKVIPSAAAGLLASPALIAHTLGFLAVYAGLHALLGAAWHLVWQPLGRGRPANAALLSFLPVLLWLLLTNTMLYPRSNFAGDFPHALQVSLFAVLGVYIAGMVVASLVVRLREAGPMLRRGALAGVLVVAAVPVTGQLMPEREAAGRELPDILLIGVDSLRTDHLGHGLTPNIDAALAGSAVVERTWTPLGRTFPSMVSMLTGRYPNTHGGYYNLMHRDAVDDADSLAHWLGELGYERVYAIDETRFSNIDASYGFDRLVTPGIGAFDFLVGTFNDLPLVNLLAQSRAGAALFPYIHLNRALSRHYRPEVFDRELAREISRLDPGRPLFLLAHFELPHWPYDWAHEPDPVEVPETLAELAPGYYHAALAEADRQFGALVDTLAEHGRFDDAVLVVFSDHGEAFRDSEPDWIAQDGTGARVPLHAGHGSNVFSAVQYEVLLGFRGYGREAGRVRPGVLDGVTASLVDLRPTLHEWLELEDTDMDGVSLFGLLTGEADPQEFDGRVVTLESGFSLPSIEAGNPDAAEIVEQGADYYAVSAGGRLYIRDDWLPFLRSQKQRAAVSGQWILGALPRDGEGASWDLLLADLDAHRYWDLREAPSLPDDAPADALLTALCGHFGADPVFALEECR